MGCCASADVAPRPVTAATAARRTTNAIIDPSPLDSLLAIIAAEVGAGLCVVFAGYAAISRGLMVRSRAVRLRQRPQARARRLEPWGRPLLRDGRTARVSFVESAWACALLRTRRRTGLQQRRKDLRTDLQMCARFVTQRQIKPASKVFVPRPKHRGSRLLRQIPLVGNFSSSEALAQQRPAIHPGALRAERQRMTVHSNASAPMDKTMIQSFLSSE